MSRPYLLWFATLGIGEIMFTVKGVACCFLYLSLSHYKSQSCARHSETTIKRFPEQLLDYDVPHVHTWSIVYAVAFGHIHPHNAIWSSTETKSQVSSRYIYPIVDAKAHTIQGEMAALTETERKQNSLGSSWKSDSWCLSALQKNKKSRLVGPKTIIYITTSSMIENSPTILNRVTTTFIKDGFW